MNEYESLNHTKWECKYNVVFIPKYRRKALYGSLRRHLGSMFRELARHKECEIGEGHLMVDHVPLLIASKPYGNLAISTQLGPFPTGHALSLVRLPVSRSIACTVMLCDNSPTASR